MVKIVIREVILPLVRFCKINLQKLKVHKFYIWEGLYTEYKQVIINSNTWGESKLEKQYLNSMQKYLSSIDKNSFLPKDVSEEYILLPLLIALFSRDKSVVTILDFGGGLGISYIQLKRCFNKNINIQYHIVETESMCNNSKELFTDNSNIFFHTALPENIHNIDIVYVSSSLQYIEGYKDLLENLGRLNALYVFFVKLSAGEFPTYYTKQVNENKCEIPYIFINIHEIVEIMSKKGYSVIYKSVLPRIYNQDNFPEKYRMNNTCNLLFEKVK